MLTEPINEKLVSIPGLETSSGPDKVELVVALDGRVLGRWA